MAPPPALRPENAIRRADELVSVGEPMAALQSLSDLLSSRRSRFADAATLEPIIFKFLQLGVDLRKGKVIKEGLYQYKKHMQYTTEGLLSVGAVARKFIDLIETKMASVQAEADTKEESAKEEADDDLEGGVTPENLLTSVFEQEQSVGGFNNDDTSAWLRFTWESYRTTLDFLRNNSQLEITYAGVVNRTMQFCYKYNRKNEFKRLAEMLRQHLDAANYQQKYGQYTVDLSDADTLQRYSDQRFQQVNVSVKLELWHEAFRSIEDVHHLMGLSKRAPKPSVLANYYENLAKIFFVSGNYLLHAAAWEKFYNLYLKNPKATKEDFQFYSSQFLLSALSIQLDDLPVAGFDPQIRLCDLLDLENKPTRSELIVSSTDNKVLEKVDADILKLYEILESKFDISTIRAQLSDLLPALTTKPYFAQYVTPLRNLLVRRSIVEVSKMQESIKLDALLELLSFPAPMEISIFELEKYLIQAAMDDYVSISIDHENDTVVFAQDPFDAWQASVVEETEAGVSEDKSESKDEEKPTEGDAEDEAVEQVFTRNSEVRFKLTDLSKMLKANEKYQSGSYLQKVKLVREELIREKEEVVKREKEFAEIRSKQMEEQRKRMDEEKKIAAKRALEDRQRRMAEENAAVESSMEKEAERRAQEKLERETEAIHEQEMLKLITETNENGVIHIDPKEAKNLTSDKINQMVIEQVAKNQKDLQERMTHAFKRIDHTERAYRQVELPLLSKDAQLQKDRDLENYNAFKKKLIETAKSDHEKKLALHNRLHHIYDSFKEYKANVCVTKEQEFKKYREARLAELEEAKRQRIEQVRRQRYEAKVAEVQAQLDEEARQREAESKAEELAKRRAERERINQERDEIARKQREIEEMLESRTQAPASTTPAPLPAVSSPPPAPDAAPASNKPLSMSEKLRLKRMANQGGRN